MSARNVFQSKSMEHFKYLNVDNLRDLRVFPQKVQTIIPNERERLGYVDRLKCKQADRHTIIIRHLFLCEVH